MRIENMKRCKKCGTILSIYNKGKYCFLHRRRKVFKDAEKAFDTNDYISNKNMMDKE